MNTPSRAFASQRALLWVVYIVAGALGAWFGWVFGRQLGGMLLSAALAVMGALVCSVIIGDLAERLVATFGRRGD